MAIFKYLADKTIIFFMKPYDVWHARLKSNLIKFANICIALSNFTSKNNHFADGSKVFLRYKTWP